MYKEIRQIEGIKSLDLYNGNLFFLSSKGEIPQLTKLDIRGLITDRKFPGDIFINKNFLIWQDMFGKAVVYDLENETTRFINPKQNEIYTFRKIDLSSVGMFVVNRRVEGKKELCYFKVSENRFVPIANDISASLDGGNIVLALNKNIPELTRVDLAGQIIWKTYVEGVFLDNRQESKQTIPKNIIGLFNNIVWVGLSSGELLGLHVNTGNVVERLGYEHIDLKHSSFILKKGDSIPFGEFMQLDETKGELFGLRNTSFMRVDLRQRNLILSFADVQKTMIDHKLTARFRNYFFPANDDLIYFCDDIEARIGIFHRPSLKVIWSYSLQMQKEGITQILEMKYAHNMWYILDRNETLHIFERSLL